MEKKKIQTGPPRLGRQVETGWGKPRKDAARPQGLQTGWGKVAEWYHDTVEEQSSYQKDLILPNLLRLMDIKKSERVLDLACGEGFFSRRFNRLGAKVIAVDIAKELIAIAKSNRENRELSQNIANKNETGIQFHVAPADKIPFVSDNSIDKIAIVLALQNIENAQGVFAECSRVLKHGGKLFLVLNHPAFRIPKQSSWGWDEVANRVAYSADREKGETIQYRRVDRYLSELREKIDMHPGNRSFAKAQDDRFTVSFHRPLQFYFKALKKVGLAVTGLEEWSSNKKSEPGPRQEAENRARAEFPLFLFMEATKI